MDKQRQKLIANTDTRSLFAIYAAKYFMLCLHELTLLREINVIF